MNEASNEERKHETGYTLSCLSIYCTFRTQPNPTKTNTSNIQLRLQRESPPKKEHLSKLDHTHISHTYIYTPYIYTYIPTNLLYNGENLTFLPSYLDCVFVICCTVDISPRYCTYVCVEAFDSLFLIHVFYLLCEDWLGWVCAVRKPN
jgi:hypothetical protein